MSYYQTPQPVKPAFNRVVIIAFVASIVGLFILGGLEIAALIISIRALVQLNKTGERGRGLAIVTLVISAIGTILWIAGFFLRTYR